MQRHVLANCNASSMVHFVDFFTATSSSASADAVSVIFSLQSMSEAILILLNSAKFYERFVTNAVTSYEYCSIINEIFESAYGRAQKADIPISKYLLIKTIVNRNINTFL